MNATVCKKGSIYCKIGQYFSPNCITYARGIFAFIAIAPWLYYEDTSVRIPILIFWGICWLGDLVDGKVARASGQVTEKGKWLDPCVDKFQFYACIFVFWNMLEATIFILFALDVASTLLRYYDRSDGVQGAVSYGKYKTFCAVTAFFFFGASSTLEWELLVQIANFLLISATLLACLSLTKRYAPRRIRDWL